MTDHSYVEPVAKLLALGDPSNQSARPDYLALGLTREHVPDLIRMATDPNLNDGDPESSEVWAPVHAWRALGELRAEEAAEPLLELFGSDDYALQDLPDVYASIGVPAIPVLSRYVADESRSIYTRGLAADALGRVGARNPEGRAACVEALTRELSKFRENDPELNAFLVGALLDLNAREALGVLRAAHEADRVDTTLNGDWESVSVQLGVDPDATGDRSELDVGMILSRLETPGTKFPYSAVKAAVANREEITPYLLEILKKAPEELASEDNYGHLFAMYLLAQFRERRALLPIVEHVSGPADAVHGMAADILTNGLGHVLASVAGGDAAPIKRLVENREADAGARGSALEALVTMAATGQLSYDEVVAYLERLFDGGLEREPSNVWNVLVSAAADLRAKRLQPRIERAFDEELVDELFTSREGILDRLSEPAEDPLGALDRDRYRLVDDILDETHLWTAFRPEPPPKVERTLPRFEVLSPLPYDLPIAPPGRGKSSSAKKKAKNKRKSAKSSRKKNRR